jgi:hypothetical protein
LLERDVPGLDSALLARVVARLVDLEPAAIAVLLTGSYAKGTADGASDVDLMAITTAAPLVDYRTWFEGLLHISAGAKTADSWLAGAREPAEWALGFPAVNEAHYLWATGEARSLLGEAPSLVHPAGVPELEDFVEDVMKAKRCARLGDEPGLRWFARLAATISASLLIPLNPERIVRDRREALAALLSLRNAPARYAADVPVCLGLTEASATDVRAAVERLGRDLLAFLRVQAPDVDDRPFIPAALADGTIERHLEQSG